MSKWRCGEYPEPDLEYDWRLTFECGETETSYDSLDSVPRYGRTYGEVFSEVEDILDGYLPKDIDGEGDWVLTKVTCEGITVYEEGDNLIKPAKWLEIFREDME